MKSASFRHVEERTNNAERTVEGAVDVYLERMARLVDHGVELAKAKNVCMYIAQVWLDEDPDRTKWEPKITAALAARIASIASKRDLAAALKRELDAATKRDTDAVLKRTLDAALQRDVDAALKRDLEVARQRLDLAQLRHAAFLKWFAIRLRDLVLGPFRGSGSASN